jgi:hypothetical protein
MSTDSARMSIGDWESYAAANGLPDGYVTRHVWDAGFDTGYQRGWHAARASAVSRPAMAIGLAVTVVAVVLLAVVR